MFRTYAAWVRGATDADVAMIQLAMNSERSPVEQTLNNELQSDPVAKLGTGLATGPEEPKQQLSKIKAKLKWRRGWKPIWHIQAIEL